MVSAALKSFFFGTKPKRAVDLVVDLVDVNLDVDLVDVDLDVDLVDVDLDVVPFC